MMFLEDIHCMRSLPQDVIVREIALPGLASLEQHPCLLAAIQGVQPSIVSRHKVCNHQGDLLTLCIWNGPLALVDPSNFAPVICIICGLIVMPHHSWIPMWKSIKVCISPLWKCWFQFLPCWEKHFLLVSYNILSFVSIYKLTSRISCPSVIHHTHPSLG